MTNQYGNIGQQAERKAGVSMSRTHDESGVMEIDPDDIEPVAEEDGDGRRLAELLLFDDRRERGRPAGGDPGSGVFRLDDLASRMPIDRPRRASAAPRLPARRVPAARAESLPLETTTTDMPPPLGRPSSRRLLISASVAAAIVLALSVAAVFVAQKRRARAADDEAEARIALQIATLERLHDRLAEAGPARAAAPVEEDAVAPRSVEDPGDRATEAPRHRRRGHARHRAVRKSPGETGSGRSEIDALLGAGARPAPVAAPERRGAPGSPSWSEISAAMARLERRASSCAIHGQGAVQIQITVSGSGRVRTARSVGASAGTPAGRCVEKLARKARVPGFDGDAFTFVHSVPVR